ncbi:GNAT family N-acetyltransferase [Pseudoalteromonas luteoviolacea]|uniref:GNAT family N-acetyltransferase n=1 Tax=Pseudoalteromonas luteoviolacea TaxID=43657 RepID=UPI000A985CFE|nr:GNAT family N-acetyltransferase [Pseudoalteromonas luteoviolacea]
MNKELVFYYLADKPEYLPTVARWYYLQWCEQSGRYTLAQITEKLRNSLSRHALPQVVIAMMGSKLVAAAELKIREMDDYPQYEHWIGGVYVDAQMRGMQIGKRLVSYVVSQAKLAQIKTLYLQTEQLDGGLYRQLGFEPMFETHSTGYHVLVMKKSLSLSV